MSTQISNPKSRIILLVAAVGLAALAAFLVHLYLQGMSDRLRAKYANKTSAMAQVVVARTDLPVDAAVDVSHFSVREIAADLVPPDAVMPEDIERAEGQTLKLGLPRGRSLQWGYLSSGATPSFSDSIKNDKRALTIAVDELNSISGMIRPNDRIDLFYIADSINAEGSGGGNSKVVVPLLQNISVKATGNITRREIPPGGGEAIERQYSTLTLDLPPKEAGRVILAQEQGALRAVLKHSTDSQSTGYALTTRADLMGSLGAPRAPGNLIAMYVGGQQGGMLAPQYVLPGTAVAAAARAGMPGGAGAPIAPASPITPPGVAQAGPAEPAWADAAQAGVPVVGGSE